MKIKVLLVPTITIVSGFLAINHIKPDFDTYIQKRAERDNVKMAAEKADATLQNAISQKSQLDQNAPQVEFLNRLVPKEKDEARSLDNFNFIITQSGLITSRIGLQEVAKEDPTDSVFATTDQIPADPLMTVAPEGMPAEAVIAPVYKAPEKESYIVTLEAVGGYSNIKEFVQKLESFDRLHSVDSFKISTTQNGTDDEAAQSGTLTLTTNLDLPYQPAPSMSTGQSIVLIPSLQTPDLDITGVTDFQGKKTTTVPDSVLGTDGKSNPFE